MCEEKLTEIEKAKQGSEEVMTKLLQENVGLIWSIVKRFSGRRL